MRSLRIAWIAAAGTAIVLAGSRAHAQSQAPGVVPEIDVMHPGSTSAGAATEEFDITAVPPPSREEIERQQDEDDDDDEAEDWARDSQRELTRLGQIPPALVADKPQLRDGAARRWLGIGLTVGAGSPLGVGGVFVDVTPHPRVSANAGIGVGGAFGWGIGGGVDVRAYTFGRFAAFAGASFATNFTPDNARNSMWLSAPSNSYWLGIETGLEYRSQPGWFARLAVGWTWLLNTGDFTNVQAGGFYGAPTNTTIGNDAVSAADAHDAGYALNMPYVHFDFGYHLR